MQPKNITTMKLPSADDYRKTRGWFRCVWHLSLAIFFIIATIGLISLNLFGRSCKRRVNAISLTDRLVFEKKSFLFDSVPPWKFSVWAHRFSCLDKYFSYFLDEHNNFFHRPIKKQDYGVFHI